MTKHLDLDDYCTVEVIIITNNDLEERYKLKEEMIASGYASPEKVVEVVREIRKEILAEKGGKILEHS